jgi:thioredoxin 1
MKKCLKCKQDKEDSEFHKNKTKKDGLQSYCKPCLNEAVIGHYRNNLDYRNKQRSRFIAIKARVDEYKENLNGCPCGEKDIVCLDFHHVNSDKDLAIGTMVSRGYHWDRILKEIEKCLLVCANCHRKIHAGKHPIWYKSAVARLPLRLKERRSTMLELNEVTFEEGTREGLVLVDFYADWCGPCRALAPTLEMLQNVKVAKVNIEESSALAVQYRVSSIPLLVFMKDGVEVDRLLGVQSLGTLQEKG